MISTSIVGDRVRRLRTALGLSQADLAERVGLATGSVSMLENGRLPVDSSILETLAAVLDCSPIYLSASRAEPLTSKPHLRAYADAPSRFVDRTIADTVTAVQFARELDLSMMPDVLPLFDGDLNDDDAIEEFAQVVRAHAGLEAGDVVRNAIRAAERLGCVVLPMDSELGRHLGLSMRVDGRPVIRVSRPTAGADNSVPGDRQRFTVAHELGHLVLHQDNPPPPTAVEATRMEKQAHRFGASFLAPAEALLADLDARGGRVTLTTLAQLKEIWGVAIKALVMRFRHLGVIDEDQARSLYKQISARRWNTVEPVPVGNESAVWMARAIEKKLADQPNPIIAAGSKVGLGSSYLTRWTDWSPVVRSSDSNVVDFDQGRIRVGSTSPSRSRTIARLPVRPAGRPEH